MKLILEIAFIVGYVPSIVYMIGYIQASQSKKPEPAGLISCVLMALILACLWPIGVLFFISIHLYSSGAYLAGARERTKELDELLKTTMERGEKLDREMAARNIR